MENGILFWPETLPGPPAIIVPIAFFPITRKMIKKKVVGLYLFLMIQYL